MSRVFIPNEPMRWNETEARWEPVYDLRPARTFGELVFLQGQRTPADPDTLAEALWDQLDNFNPESDYFMPMGKPIVGAMAAAIIALVTDGNFRLLQYDREQRAYTIVHAQLQKEEAA